MVIKSLTVGIKFLRPSKYDKALNYTTTLQVLLRFLKCRWVLLFKVGPRKTASNVLVCKNSLVILDFQSIYKCGVNVWELSHVVNSSSDTRNGTIPAIPKSILIND